MAQSVFFLFLVVALVVPVSMSAVLNAQGATPGLSPGMWAHYSLSGNESSGTVDALFTVQKVDGNNVTFTDLDTFQDGHTSTDTIVVNILTGPTIPSSGQYFIISPEKNVGDLVYPGDTRHYGQFPIQDITGRTYGAAKRQSAHVQGSNSSQVCIVGSPCPTTHEDFYWDNPSGIFTEIIKTYNGATVLHVTMSSTSIWPPDNPIDPYVVPSAIVSITSAGLIGIIVVARYRKRKPRRAR